MSTVPYEARSTTAGPKPKERCRYCLDTGWVVVMLRDPVRAVVTYPDKETGGRKPVTIPTALERARAGAGDADETQLRYEEMGPCPMCQLGFLTEFPRVGEKEKTGPWGVEGFWKGRDPMVVVALEEPARSRCRSRRTRRGCGSCRLVLAGTWARRVAAVLLVFFAAADLLTAASRYGESGGEVSWMIVGDVALACLLSLVAWKVWPHG